MRREWAVRRGVGRAQGSRPSALEAAIKTEFMEAREGKEKKAGEGKRRGEEGRGGERRGGRGGEGRGGEGGEREGNVPFDKKSPKKRSA